MTREATSVLPEGVAPIWSGRALFELGALLATPGALDYLRACDRLPWEFLAFHAGGIWGDLDESDWKANDRAVKDGGRVLSAYLVEGPDQVRRKIWVLTEAVGDDGRRACSTLLMPQEY